MPSGIYPRRRPVVARQRLLPSQRSLIEDALNKGEKHMHIAMRMPGVSIWQVDWVARRLSRERVK